MKGRTTLSFLRKIEPDIPDTLRAMLFLKPKIYKEFMAH